MLPAAAAKPDQLTEPTIGIGASLPLTQILTHDRTTQHPLELATAYLLGGNDLMVQALDVKFSNPSDRCSKKSANWAMPSANIASHDSYTALLATDYYTGFSPCNQPGIIHSTDNRCPTWTSSV